MLVFSQGLSCFKGPDKGSREICKPQPVTIFHTYTITLAFSERLDGPAPTLLYTHPELPSLPLYLSPLLLPLKPTTRKLPNLLPAPLPRQPRRRPTPNPSFAVEHHASLPLRRLLEAEAFEELLGGEEEGVGAGGEREVDGGGDAAGGLQLPGLADVDYEGGCG